MWVEIVAIGLLVGIGLIVGTRFVKAALRQDLLILWLRMKGGKLILEPLEEE
tara:strand:- start:2256 stop:2411 length:156 start_codon:yes stop_codon:yes gene_type:complete